MKVKPIIAKEPKLVYKGFYSGDKEERPEILERIKKDAENYIRKN